MYFVIIIRLNLNCYNFSYFFIGYQSFKKLVTFYLELDIQTIITKLSIWQAKSKVNLSSPELKKHKCIKFMQSFKVISDFSIFSDNLKYYVPTSCMKIIKMCPTETR